MGGVVKAVTNVVKSVVNVVANVVKAVVNVVSDVINFVASPFMALLGIGSIPDFGAAQEAQRNEGVLVTKQGGGAVSIPVIYGYRRVGGVITFCETGSTNNKYLWVAYVFSEGVIEGINEILIDDNQLSADVVRGLNSGQIVDVPDAKYKGRVKLQWFPGVFFNNPADSPAGTQSILKDAPSWKTSMVYNGLAVLFARYEWLAVTTQAEADANPFSGSIPQIQLSLMGKRIASLRTGAGTEGYTYGGSGYTERYSTNPAEVMLDYLRNPRYGKGLVNSDIDWDSFYIAAQKCNQEIFYTTTVSGPILTFNGVIDTASTIFGNVKMILTNMRGYLPYVQGKYKLKIEDAGNPTNILSGAAEIAAVFNRDSIIGEITYTGIERTSKYNQVAVSYVDPDQKFSIQQVVYPPDEESRQVYINFDGGRENKIEMTMGAITNQQIARDFARLIFNKSRFQESCSLTVSAEGFNLEVGDNIFIQSNILNFGEVPWRVVSLKLNNDYTFDLGCVRNPDFIYPYVTPNTPDTIVAPYIPKGASILPPLTGGEGLVGLVPPVTAPIFNRDIPINAPTPINPPTTVTTGTNGGGVGGGTGSVNTVGGTAPTTPQVPLVLKDVVAIDNVVYTKVTAETANAMVYFKQPDNAMYSGLQVYYRIGTDRTGPWNELPLVQTLAGSGNTISFAINGLLNKNSSYYDIRTRVRYSSGEYSTVVGTAQLLVSATLGAGRTAEDPGDSTLVVESGWNLPTAKVSRRDDYFDALTGSVIKVSGSFTNPRSVRITLAQYITFTTPNTDIVGVRVYYKPNNTDYYYEQDVNFGPTYAAGASTTFTVSGLGVPGSFATYDFIFRALYRDGSVSSKWTRKPLATLEYPTENVDIFTGFSYYGEVVTATPINFKTVAQGITDGVIVDPIDMKIGIAGIQSYTTGGSAFRIWILPPDATAESQWRGVRIYRRKVIAGANPAYEALPDLLRGTTTAGVWQTGPGTYVNTHYFTIGGVDYTAEYQYLIVPLVANGFVTVEGNQSWFGQGLISGTTPANGDWAPSLGFRLGSTSQLKGQLSTSFVAPAVSPTAVVTGWKGVNTNPAGAGASVLAVYNPYGSVNFIQNYYEIKVNVSAISNFNELQIYRRTNLGNQNKTAPYWGIGYYEKLLFNTSFSGYSAGVFTIKLKLPANEYEFVTSATTPPGRGLSGAPANAINYQSPALARTSDEFFIVIKSNGVVSGKAWRLGGVALGNNAETAGPLGREVDWPLAEDTAFASGWLRKISEARTAPVNTSTSSPAGTYYYMSIIYGGRNVGYVNAATDPGVY